MAALTLVHDRLSISLLLFMAVLGVWGIVAYVRGDAFAGSLAGAFVIGQALIAVQVLAGVALVVAGAAPAETTHYLYGATAILVLPFVWSFLRDRDQRQALLFYSVLALFIAGLAVRGITTGGG
ncbi:MAG: hypothetical protein WKF80_00655 [Thermomicrobiales bacterium]